MSRTEDLQSFLRRRGAVHFISGILKVELQNFPYISLVIDNKYFSLVFHILYNNVRKGMIFNSSGGPQANKYFVTISCNKNLTTTSWFAKYC